MEKATNNPHEAQAAEVQAAEAHVETERPTNVQRKSRLEEILREISPATSTAEIRSSILPAASKMKRVMELNLGGVRLSLDAENQAKFEASGIYRRVWEERRCVSLSGSPLHRRVASLLGFDDRYFQGENPGGLLMPTFHPNPNAEHAGFDLGLYLNQPMLGKNGQLISFVRPKGTKQLGYFDVPPFTSQVFQYRWKQAAQDINPSMFWVQDSTSADAITSAGDPAICLNGTVANTYQLREMLESTGLFEQMKGCYHFFLFNSDWPEAPGFYQTIRRLIGILDPDGWKTRMIHLEPKAGGMPYTMVDEITLDQLMNGFHFTRAANTVADEMSLGRTPDDFIWDALPYNLFPNVWYEEVVDAKVIDAPACVEAAE